MKNNYDIVVVGGVSGGSMAALHASKGGASVCLLEKTRDIGYPVRCGEAMGEYEEDKEKKKTKNKKKKKNDKKDKKKTKKRKKNVRKRRRGRRTVLRRRRRRRLR